MKPKMPNTPIHRLKRALLDTYGSFADRRIKNIDLGDRFIVDGRTDSDIAADGHVYGWFCSMFLDIADADTVQLSILNIPMSSAVAAWLSDHAEPFGRGGYRVIIARGTQASLSALSDRGAAITARGKRYDTPSYKYAVPRVVDSLQRLEAALNQAWDLP